jgi:transcriptional regulator with XRE-family HTH domain
MTHATELPSATAMIDAEANHDCAQKVREELARRRLTRQQLAHDAKLSLSTLEKALSGRRPFTLATIIRLEQALGIGLRDVPRPDGAASVNGSAPDALGAYSRPAVLWLEGNYLTLRYSFSDPNAIFAYRTAITWDEEAGVLKFREADRLDTDFTQFGEVSVPHQSGHIYLVTNRHGQYRLIIVSRPTIKGEMHGILSTLQAGRGAQLTPVSTPIVLATMQQQPAGQALAWGVIAAGHPAFERYRGMLQRTLGEPFALFPRGAHR